MRIAVFVFAVLVFAASLLPFVRREAWWIRVFDFPRVQVLLLALLALGLIWLFGSPGAWLGRLGLFAAASAVLMQVVCIFPYTPLARREVLDAGDAAAADATLSLLIANVLMDNHRHEGLLALVERYRPDILLLLEPDDWWEMRMRALEADYPHAMKRPLDNEYGMLLYSRLPLLDARTRYLLREGIPSMHMQVQLRSGAPVWLHCVHPEPPSPTEARTSLPRDAELLVVGREVKARGCPAIVAGDLNDVAWSYTTRLFQKTSRLLDPRRGRGMFNTFNAKVPMMRWPLDHVFHSEHFLLAELQRLPAFGSDHFPVYVRLVLQPGAEVLQEGPAAGRKDEQTAAQKMRKAR